MRVGESEEQQVKISQGLRALAGLSLHLTHSFFLFLPFLLAAVCQILPKGVVAVLGPSSSPASSSIISNICGEKEVSTGPGWKNTRRAEPWTSWAPKGWKGLLRMLC